MEMNRKNYIKTAILFCIFVVYTLVVKFVAVGPGTEGTDLGLCTFNQSIAKVVPFNNTWYQITEYLGYAALGVCAGFALFGLFQLIKGKSLKAVDKEIWVLAGFYVVVIAFYALFEVIVINYRPVILDEGLEASYPSSHTVLAACVFISAFILFEKYIVKNKVVKGLAQAACIVAAVFTVCGRFISWPYHCT